MGLPSNSCSEPPNSNPFQIRKAEDLEEAQIQRLFVEPSPEFLASIVGERTHHLLQGGRGAGKTMTLRKLGAALSPPNQNHPLIGVYLSLDVTQFASFEESKIGTSSAWLFESYFAGIVIQEFLHSLIAVLPRLSFRSASVTAQEFCRRIGEILGNDRPRPHESVEALHAIVNDANRSLLKKVSSRLGSLRSSDLDLTFTFFKLREITDSVTQTFNIGTAPLTTLILLDRYDDLSTFQQTIANGLFNLPPPRNLYVVAGIAPPGLATLELPNGQKLQQFQHFRTVSIERSIPLREYTSLPNTIAGKYLAQAKGIASSNLKTSLAKLLGARSDQPYSGLSNFARLSDGIIFHFLLLCESSVDYSAPISRLHAGNEISGDAQTQAAKKIAKVFFANISAKIAGSYGPVKHLVAELLKRFAGEQRGPRVIFHEVQGQPEMDLMFMAIRESIFKEVDEEAPNADDFIVSVNRLLLPYRDLPVRDQPALEVSLQELRATIADAGRTFGARPTASNAQSELFQSSVPTLVMASPSPKKWEAAVYEFQAFLTQHRVTAHFVQSSVEYSNQLISEATRDLTPELYKAFTDFDFLTNVSIGLAGSFGRAEAQPNQSDADLFIVGNLLGKESLANDVLAHCCEWFTRRGVKITDVQLGLTVSDQRFQPFPTPIDLETITRNATTPQDTEEDKTRRMALISESVGVFNEGYFHRVRRDLIDLYRTREFLEANSLPTPLLNEFNVWCKSFVARIQVQKKTGQKYDKRKLQRSFMQFSTVLACLAHLCQDSNDAFPTFREVFDLPVALRLHHVLSVSYEGNRAERASHVKAILKLYNDGLVSLRASVGADSEPQRVAATECAEMLATEFAQLQDIILRDANPRLKKNYDEIAVH